MQCMCCTYAFLLCGLLLHTGRHVYWSVVVLLFLRGGVPGRPSGCRFSFRLDRSDFCCVHTASQRRDSLPIFFKLHLYRSAGHERPMPGIKKVVTSHAVHNASWRLLGLSPNVFFWFWRDDLQPWLRALSLEKWDDPSSRKWGVVDKFSTEQPIHRFNVWWSEQNCEGVVNICL